MASPYFQPIQTKSADYSGITRAGEAMRDGYQNIGAALGSIASTYFTKEKTKEKARQAVDNGGAMDILLNAGFDEEDIKTMHPDRQYKLITGAIDEVGYENFQKSQIQQTQARQLQENQKLQLEQNKILLEQAQRAEQSMLRQEELNRHFYRLNEHGEPAMNLNGFTKWNEYAADIAKFAKGKNLKGFSPANFGSLLNSGDIDLTNEQELMAMADQWAAVNDLPPIEHQKIRDIALQRFIDPLQIQKDYNEYLNSDPTMKNVMESQAAFETMGAKLPEAFSVNAQGEYTITNTTAMMDFRRQLAKIGSGVGVMTDKDVDDYMGETDWKAVLDRTIFKWSDSDKGKSALLSPEDAEQLHKLYEVTRAHYDKKAADGFKNALISVEKAYPTLTRSKLASFLNPKFTKHLTDLSDAQFAGAEARIEDFNIDGDVAQAIMRDFESGRTYAEVFDHFKKVNPNESDERIHVFLEAAKEHMSPERIEQRKKHNAEKIPNQIRQILGAEVELLGADNHAEAFSYTLGFIASEIGQGVFEKAMRLSKNHPLRKKVEAQIKAAVQDKFSELASGKVEKSLAKHSAVQLAANKMKISLIDKKGKQLTDKELLERMRKEAMTRAIKQKGGIGNALKKLISPKNLVKKGALGGGVGTIFMLMYDAFAIAEATDGVVELHEVEDIVRRAKADPAWEDQPEEFWVDLKKDLLLAAHEQEQRRKTSGSKRYGFGGGLMHPSSPLYRGGRLNQPTEPYNLEGVIDKAGRGLSDDFTIDPEVMKFLDK